MKVKLRRKSKLDIQNNLAVTIEIKNALEFIHPELTPDEVKDKLVFLLATIADPTLLKFLNNQS